jgi:hypothetical protein
MNVPRHNRYNALLLSLLCLVMAACSSPPQSSRAVVNQTDRAVNFSGFWELDYSQSDNIQANLNALVRDVRQQTQQRAQGTGVYQQAGPGMIIGGPGDTNSGASIIGLAQMADLVTQSQLLEVTQDEYKIRVKREGDYALSCEFYPGQYHTVETPLGREICGWEQHQLVFKTMLPEGLTIQQVLSLAPDGQRLNIATTVISDRVTAPFTVNRVYVQYVPQDDGYSCKMTISKGRVCTTEKSR